MNESLSQIEMNGLNLTKIILVVVSVFFSAVSFEETGGGAASGSGGEPSKKTGASGEKQGPWTIEETERLRAYMAQLGNAAPDWGEAVVAVATGRSRKSVRERWVYFANPDLDWSDWTQADQDLLKRAVARYGPKWAKICKHYFPNRSQKLIERRWTRPLASQIPAGLPQGGFPAYPDDVGEEDFDLPKDFLRSAAGASAGAASGQPAKRARVDNSDKAAGVADETSSADDSDGSLDDDSDRSSADGSESTYGSDSDSEGEAQVSEHLWTHAASSGAVSATAVTDTLATVAADAGGGGASSDGANNFDADGFGGKLGDLDVSFLDDGDAAELGQDVLFDMLSSGLGSEKITF